MRELAAADPSTASTTIRALAANCDGVTRALDRLSRARIRGRLLIGLVDDVLARAREVCPDTSITGTGPASELARARLAEAQPADAVAQLVTTSEPAIRWRRAELLERLGRTDAALAEVDAVPLDEQAAQMRRFFTVTIAARANRTSDLARIIASAPLPEQPRLAFRAAADTPVDALDALAAVPGLATAAADRLEQVHGAAAALAARQHAVTAAPELAEHWDALARAQIATGKIDDALASWDRASTIAPGQPAYRTTPIKALVIAGHTKLAHERAYALAAHARERKDVDVLVTASAGAAAASLPALALELAGEARALRPRDGQLAFLVAQRYAEAGHRADAADRYVELLVCGAHGRPWHRHEVSAKLVEVGDPAVILAAIARPRTCDAAEPADLARYLEAIRKQLAQ
ncbi:MAG: hypothetical protein M4D80_00615 [Myxococcota bacterium]|nr:hypothetical protein [Myxococcota bacterium]